MWWNNFTVRHFLRHLLSNNMFVEDLDCAPYTNGVITNVYGEAGRHCLSLFLREGGVSFVFRGRRNLNYCITDCLSIFNEMSINLISLNVTMTMEVTRRSRFMFYLRSTTTNDISIFLHRLTLYRTLYRVLSRNVKTRVRVHAYRRYLF